MGVGLCRSSSAQSDSSGFMDGDTGEGDVRMGSAVPSFTTTTTTTRQPHTPTATPTQRQVSLPVPGQSSGFVVTKVYC
ncbi:hypothetical protein E2C01_076566 [Portunus trituberculatus]|uniref:Uncharacterized protein n=1 Tax=Portunus trituberculatus TaxID=210409 RepID=A0A5B7II32_PORTR|nr:hypothetical protein [Portunus trituberculatus]